MKSIVHRLYELGYDLERRGDPMWHFSAWGEPDWEDELLSEDPRRPEIGVAQQTKRTAWWREQYEKIRGDLIYDRASRLKGQREAFLLAYRQPGATIASVKRLLQISDSTYKRWKNNEAFAYEIEQIQAERKLVADEVGEPQYKVQLPGESRKDFIWFRQYYFGYDSPKHHLKIVDAIENAEQDSFTGIILPPEAGKTTLITDWVCWQIAKNPSVRIAYVSEKGGIGGLAGKVLGDLKERLTNPDYAAPGAPHQPNVREFIARYGPFRDDEADQNKPWTQQVIRVHKSLETRNYTVEAMGWTSRIQGSRYDYIIFDDIQSIDSLNHTDRMIDVVQSKFFTRVTSETKIIYIGNRIGRNDVVEKMIDDDMFDDIIYIPAIDDDGNSYWPEVWPMERLERRKKRVKRMWNISYMQAPELEDNVTFPEELIDESKDMDEETGRIGFHPPSHKVSIGLDPALVGGNAIVCAATTREEFRVVDCQVDYNIGRNEAIIDVIDLMCRYNPVELVIERNAAQRGIARDQRLIDLARARGFKIIEHETQRNKTDENFGVAAMTSSFIRGEFAIPWGTGWTRERMLPLVTELQNWRPGLKPTQLKQDLVMATWFLWLRWQEGLRFARQDPSAFRTTGLPWQATTMRRTA